VTAATPQLSGSRAYWEQVERADPGSSEPAGVTDARLDAPPLSLQESLDAGRITVGEQRQSQGAATEIDLAEAGYSADETRDILAGQRDRARILDPDEALRSRPPHPCCARRAERSGDPPRDRKGAPR
jgi:hypothetical protein